jgi:uncharacterized protein YutE (UPF0331/DUF86 family)
LVLDHRLLEARLRKLDKYVRKLKKYQLFPLETYLSNEDIQAIVERNFQLAIQVCMDIANYLIARLDLEVPEEEENVFVVLGKAGIIPEALANRIRGMTNFRNILVHQYLEIDSNEVHRLLTSRLEDFDQFARALVIFMENQQSDSC